MDKLLLQKGLAAMLSKVWPSFSLSGIDVKLVSRQIYQNISNQHFWQLTSQYPKILKRSQVTPIGRRIRRRTLCTIMGVPRPSRGILLSKSLTGWLHWGINAKQRQVLCTCQQSWGRQGPAGASNYQSPRQVGHQCLARCSTIKNHLLQCSTITDNDVCMMSSNMLKL